MGGSNKSYQAAGEKRNYLQCPVVHDIVSPCSMVKGQLKALEEYGYLL